MTPLLGETAAPSLTDAFVPSAHAIAIAVFAALGASTLGYLATRLRTSTLARATAWGTVALALVMAAWAAHAEPAGARMLLLISVGLVAMKAPVATEAVLAGEAPLPLGAWAAFSLGWFGMRPSAFAHRDLARSKEAPALLRRAARGFVGGALLFAAARLVYASTGSFVAAVVVLLPALSLMLHFGALTASAALWRSLGFDCRPLFDAPLRATSLAEFWGKRWNLAFSEMTALALYRPLAGCFGRPAATVAAFAASGALHELAISAPVRAGYGLPTLYFALHGALVLIERRRAVSGSPVGGMAGRAWTLLWLTLPLPALFHPPFVDAIVGPMLR